MHILCTNCGADVPIGLSTKEVTCPYCSAALFVGKQRGIAQLVMSGYVSREDAVLRLGRYLAQHECFADFSIVSQSEYYFPFWRVTSLNGKKTVFHGAITPEVESLWKMSALEGDTDKKTLMDVPEHLLLEPERLLEDILPHHEDDEGENRDDNTSSYQAALVYVPFFKIQFAVHQETFWAWIDTVSGTVHVDHLPPAPQKLKSGILAGVAVASLLVVIAAVVLLPWTLQLFVIPLLLYGIYASMMKILARLGW